MKGKLSGLLITVLLLTVVFSGCNEKDTNNGKSSTGNELNEPQGEFNETTHTYTNYTNNFSITINGNWSIDEHTLSGITLYREGLSQYEVVTIDITEPLTLTETTFEGWIETDLDTLPEWKDGFELISANYTTFKGLKAHEIIYRYGENSSGIKEKQFAIEKDNKMYYIFYGTSPIRYEKYLDEANQIINSFTILW